MRRLHSQLATLALLTVVSRTAGAQLADAEPEWYLPTGDGCRLFVQEYGRGRDTVIVVHGGFGAEQSPSDLGTIAGLQKLRPILKRRGYSEAEIARIFHGNWLEFFGRALPAGG